MAGEGETVVDPNAPVPESHRLAWVLCATHWNAEHGGGAGMGGVTWWTLEPHQRRKWLDMAAALRQTLALDPDLLNGL